MSAVKLPEISRRRRWTDKVMRGSLAAAFVIALVPLVLVVYYLIYKGLKTWSGNFFTTDPNGSFYGYPGGIRSAILGSIEMVLLASLISIPLGIGAALYLVEYGKQGWFANIVRYLTDVQTGVPSIVFGLFVYIVLVVGNAPDIPHHLFSQGYTLAAVIANEFGEAANVPIHSSALFACGLVLFVVTLIINYFARRIVSRTTGAAPKRAAKGGGTGEPTTPAVEAA